MAIPVSSTLIAPTPISSARLIAPNLRELRHPERTPVRTEIHRNQANNRLTHVGIQQEIARRDEEERVARNRNSEAEGRLQGRWVRDRSMDLFHEAWPNHTKNFNASMIALGFLIFSVGLLVAGIFTGAFAALPLIGFIPLIAGGVIGIVASSVIISISQCGYGGLYKNRERDVFSVLDE